MRGWGERGIRGGERVVWEGGERMVWEGSVREGVRGWGGWGGRVV